MVKPESKNTLTFEIYIAPSSREAAATCLGCQGLPRLPCLQDQHLPGNLEVGYVQYFFPD